MGLDIETYVQNLPATKPPYECPIQGCGKVYKSFNGIRLHLFNYDHDNPESPVAKTPKGSTKKKKGTGTPRNRSPSPEFFKPPNRDPLSYAEAQRMVEIEYDGKLHRLNIYEPLEIISQDEIENVDNIEKEERPDKLPPKESKAKTPKNKKEQEKPAAQPAPLPEASFKVLSDYPEPPKAPERPSSYYRFMEQTVEELDEAVEYDMDEEVSLFSFHPECCFGSK